MPLDPTPAESAKAMSGEPRNPDEVETTPGVPSKTLKRRETSLRAQKARLEHVCLLLEGDEPDRDYIRQIITKSLDEALRQGRREVSKQYSDVMADLQLESAKRSEAEVEVMKQGKLRAAAELKLADLRATLVRVRNGEISPEEIVI